MPGITIPSYGSTRELPSAPRALPSVRQTAAPDAAALGGNARAQTDFVGAGLRLAGDDLARVGLEMQRKEDTRVLFERETLLKDELRKRQADWSTRKGEAAVGLVDEVDRFYTEDASKFAEGLNDRQRKVWNETLNKHRGHSLDSASVWEARERAGALEDAATASIVGSINFAVDNAANDNAIATAAADIDSRVQVLGQLNGWSHERTQIERLNYQSRLHQQVIARLVDENPNAAAEYLAKHENSIDPVVLTKLRKGAEAATATARAQSFADVVMAAGMSEADAIAKARAELSGEDEVRAVAEIKTRHAELAAARERQQKNAADEAYQHYARTGSLNSIPPSVWAEMDGRDALNLRNFAEARLDRARARASNDPERKAKVQEQERIAYARLADKLAEDPVGFAEIDLVEEGAGLSDGQFKYFQDAQSKIRAGNYTEGPVDVATKRAYRELGIDGSSKQARKAQAEFLAAKQKVEADFAAKNGRAPTAKESAELVDSLVIEGTVPGMLWGRNETRRFEAVNEGKAGEFQPSAPTPVGRSAAPVVVTTKEQAQALPKGARFTYQGKEYVR